MEHQPTSGGFGWSLAEEEPYSFRGASALQLAAPFSNNKVSLFVFGFSSWISPYTSASAGESLYGRGRDH